MAEMIDAFFPPVPRVLYEKSPLAEVVCQLRFPAILKIEALPPADFQERVRAALPIFDRASGLPGNMPQMPSELVNLLGGGRPSSSFSTEDKSVVASLTAESISLWTSRYGRWEEFRRLFEPCLSALIELYSPSFFSRIGLRYTDVINRSALGINNEKWTDLLSRKIHGELAVAEIEQNLEDVQRVINIRFPGSVGSLLMRHGLGL